MMSMVRFRTNQGTFLAPTANVLEVRLATEVTSLPSPMEGIAGLIERQGSALTVLSTFGAGGRQVVVLKASAGAFGLVADEVTGVVNVSELDIEAQPLGQIRPLISGVVKSRTGLELMVSVDGLWRMLQSAEK
jgi:chemotaxis signal transduction protein